MSSDFGTARIIGLIGAALIAVGVASNIFGSIFYFLFFISAPPREPWWRSEPSAFAFPQYEGYFFVNFLSMLALVGWVLVIVSLYLFSKVYGEGRIFTYAIYSVASIIGGIILTVILLVIGIPLTVILIGIFFILAAILALIAAIILMGYFIYKSLSIMAEKSGEGLFRVAGILMLVAAITIIILVGTLLELAGAIVLAIAFYSLKPPQLQKTVEGAPLNN